MDSINKISSKKLKRSLNFTLIAVVFGKCYYSVVTDAPFTGFTRALGVSDLIYSIIVAMPFLGGILQIFASYILEKTGRRKLIFLISAYIHRLIWIPIVLVPILLPPEQKALSLWFITALIIVYSIANSVVNISYFSWMGDLIPHEIQGRYYSNRIALSTITGAVVGVIAGLYLDGSSTLVRFAVVFIVAALLGSGDASCFIPVIDPPMNIKKNKESFLKQLSEPFQSKHYMQFIIFSSVWNFAYNFSVPFFNIYAIEYLKISYFYISIFSQVIGNLSVILFIGYIGKLVDKYGNKPIVAASCAGITFLPVLWCFASPGHFGIVMSISFFLNGILFSSISLSTTNLSINMAPQKNRSMYIANYLLITSLASGAAYICGGMFMEYSKPIIDNLKLMFINGNPLINFHMLFIISCILRVFALMIFLPKVNEKVHISTDKNCYECIPDTEQAI